jgi:hypothetical protein
MALLFLAFIVSATVLGALLYRKYEQSRMSPAVSPPSGAQPEGRKIATLFFADRAGTGLRREVREIDACGEPPDCVETVIDELVNGPLGELGATLPGTFSLKSVAVSGDTAVLDLERGTWEGLPGGSSAEMTAVYSIVDTIAFNFPEIRRVRFLLEGEPMPTLKGHLDLREPIAPDFSLEAK